MKPDRKLYYKRTHFGHHREGWAVATEMLDLLQSPCGTRFYDWADWKFKDGRVLKDWAGFLHNSVTYPKDYPHKYPAEYTGKKMMPLEELVHQEFFLESLDSCRGIFTLSKYTADFLKSKLAVPIQALTHPAKEPFLKFSCSDFERRPRVASIGQWLRKYHSFFDLESRHTKVMPMIKGFERDYEEAKRRAIRDDVTLLSFLDHNGYDDLMTSAVVFLDLYDAAACNTVIECIMRCTPLLINRIDPVVDYLGEKYPFYYKSLDEASHKLHDVRLITETYAYLTSLDKTAFTQEVFLNGFVDSAIYRNMPVTMGLL